MKPQIIEYDTPIQLTLVHSWHEYEDVYSFNFKPSVTVPFMAGQNARIVAPSLEGDAGRRSLSFANPPYEPLLQFSLHTHSGSAYKQLFLNLQKGDVVELVKLKGLMTITEDTSIPVVLIAGGVGITPFRSMLLDLQHRGGTRDVTLIHVSRSAYLYQDELSLLPYPQHRIRRPDVSANLKELSARISHGQFCIAGSPLFIESIAAELIACGIPGDSILKSGFTGYEYYDD